MTPGDAEPTVSTLAVGLIEWVCELADAIVYTSDAIGRGSYRHGSSLSARSIALIFRSMSSRFLTPTLQSQPKRSCRHDGSGVELGIPATGIQFLNTITASVGTRSRFAP